MVNVFVGVLIEESLEDKKVLKEIKIIKTKIETVTEKHKTPWITKWTMHTMKIPSEKIKEVSEKISKSLDKKHNWYADFQNNKEHYIIFRNKIFCVNKKSKEEYNKAKEYGISLGIPEYQVDFKPEN